MSRTRDSPGAGLLALWKRLTPLPGGRWLFSRLLGRRVPYTGTIGATVVELEPGRVRIELRDRRKVRNHLGSVHAIALANLGELSTGLAVLTTLPPTVRGIPVRIEIAYRKKARGRLSAEAHSDASAVRDIAEPREHAVSVPIVDESGDVVATVTATWMLSPVPGA